jgi:hypothetical protein
MLIRWYDYFDHLHHKIEHFIQNIPGSGLFFRHPTQKDMDDMIRDLGYEPTDTYLRKPLSDASKCYLALLSPLLFLMAYTLLGALLSMMFVKNTTLFFDEYVKLFPLVIPFLVLFVWVLPKLFFRKAPKGSVNASVYAYGVLLSLMLPLLIIPQANHYFNAQKIEVVGTVVNKHISRKDRSITLQTSNKKLKTITLHNVHPLDAQLAHAGDTYMIKGRKSTFYFTYDTIVSIKHKVQIQ